MTKAKKTAGNSGNAIAATRGTTGVSHAAEARRPHRGRDGEYEVIGRPDTTAAGKNAPVRVKRVDRPDIPLIRSWGAHERVAVKRTGGA
jgi:hypothetical protein